MTVKRTAVVVLSGGQDSATCLALAVKTNDEVHTITFDYGQRHRVELECAEAIAKKFGVTSHREVGVSALRGLVTSALLNNATGRCVSDAHPTLADVPASFVPARNALFLTLAHALAQEVKAQEIWTGVCQTDYSGYPDCRHRFIMALEEALNIGYLTNIKIKVPLMYATKADTFRIAEDLGVLDVVLDVSHTCYNGDRARHDWGRGCGECPACRLRARGYTDFLAGRFSLSDDQLKAYGEGLAERDPSDMERLINRLCPPILDEPKSGGAQ